MCGIAGYVCKDKYEPKLDLAFPLLGVFMDTRGGDSWGYTDGNRIEKMTGEFQGGYTPAFSGAMQAALHTRYGTTGAKIAINSHPWRFGEDLIGMHNGVVYNHTELNARLFRQFDVDSMHIFQHIVEERDLSEIEAYGAIVFFQEGKIHLGRFHAGQLSVAHAEWGIMFASTDWAITQACQMAGLPEPEFYKVEEGQLYVLEGNTMYFTDTKLNFSKHIISPPAVPYRRYGGGHYDGFTEWNKWENDLTGGDTSPYEYNSKQLDNLREFPICTSGTPEKPLPRHQVMAMDNELCAFCDEALDPREPAWDTEDGLLCDDCAEYYYGGAEEIKEDEDSFVKMTVREYEKKLLEDPNLPADHPSMACCDECYTTLLADEDIFVDESSVPWVLCINCYAKESVKLSVH